MAIKTSHTFEFANFDDAVAWLKESMANVTEEQRAVVNLSGYTGAPRLPEHWRVQIDVDGDPNIPFPSKALPEPE